MRNYYITISMEENCQAVANHRKTEIAPISEQPFNSHAILASVIVLAVFILFMGYFGSL